MQNLPIYDFLTALLSKRTISNKTFLKRIKLNNKNASKGESGLENQNKKIENSTKVEDLYRLKIGNMCVDMDILKK